MAVYRKGYVFERELKLRLEREGWYVIRSGGSKKPDLIAAKEGDIRIIECKVTKNNSIYLESEEVEILKDIAKAFNANCMYAIKSKKRELSIIKLDQLTLVGKHYVVNLDNV